MSTKNVTDFFVYRYRYIVSYITLVCIILALLFVSGTMIPGGISDSEMIAATRSGNLSMGALIGNQADNIIQLPYRILQSVSMHLLGVSAISIKLPSLLLAAASLAMLYKILQLWFRRNVAIITVLLAVTSSQFLLQSQLGTAGILYFFWGVCLLLTTSMMARAKRFRSAWFILAMILAGLSLYTTFMFYVIIPLIFAALAHPHARFVVFKQPLWALVGGSVAFGIAIIPLAIGLLAHPNTFIELLAGKHIADGTFSWNETLASLSQYVNFYENSSGRILQPAYGIGLLLLGLIGLIYLLSMKYTAKNYIMSAWLLLTIPVMIVYPEVVAVTMLPLILLVAFAIDFLIRKWYGMFPYNPYARIVGLVPLTILVVTLGLSSLERFTYGYLYDSTAVAAYNDDISIISKDLRASKVSHATIAVPKNEQSFYEVYARFYQSSEKITVTPVVPEDPTKGRLYVSAELQGTRNTASNILTNGSRSDAARFYVYEKR